jgi:serine/threonine protein kinase
VSLAHEITIADRFEIREVLGRGGMGVVYRVYDRRRRMEVALKTLHSVNGATLFRFKREFRALAGIIHPNLATLYELQSSGDEWFFTMSLVEGCSFIRYVRPLDAAALVDTAAETLATDGNTEPTSVGTPTDIQSWQSNLAERRPLIEVPLELGRLRSSIRQLAEGVAAIHRAGKLHCDLKPSNVLVDGGGRVVVCDFGLVADQRDRGHKRDAAWVAGTPAYMAPEQAAGRALGEATDWYAVGGMLYEALCGQVPFVGPPRYVIELKQYAEVMPLPAAADPVLDELGALAMDLLARRPDARPSGREVLARLGGSAVVAASTVVRPRPAAAELVGRATELGALTDALARTRRARSAAVLLTGPSGVGKSALARAFVDDLRGRRAAVVLEGRCYERESVPFKALDALVDSLRAHLASLAEDELARVVPDGIGALARLFPVLSTVPAIGAAEPVAVADPLQLRYRAFGALRALLEAVATAQPTVLFIDDLQWSDADSGSFLVELVHHPQPPRVLLVASIRSDEAAANATVAALRGQHTATGVAADVTEVAIASLAEPDARALARAVLGARANDERVAALAREAEGNPFLIAELAHEDEPAAAGEGGRTLEAVLRGRIERLSNEARELLEAVAVAGRPVPIEVVARAIGAVDEATTLAVLQAGRLIRTRRGDRGELVECYHDRIRAAAVAPLEERRARRYHRRIARAFETSGHRDPLALASHWLGAGDPARAASYAATAAAQAEQALAFARAADCYRVVLDQASLVPQARRDIMRRCGLALANAGRLAAAAEAFLAAAEGAERRERLELQRLALEQILRVGQLERGLDVAKQLLGEFDVGLPVRRVGILASIAWHRARLALRGLGFAPRPRAQLDPELLLRMDTFWSLASGLSFVNPFYGTAMNMRYLRTALDGGDTYRAALAMTTEVGYLSTQGTRGDARIDRAVALSRELAAGSGEPHAVGLATAMHALSLFMRGRFLAALEALRAGETMLGEQVVGARFEVDNCQQYRCAALAWSGQLGELARQVPALLGEALDRGDEYQATGLRGGRANIAWLVRGEPDEARRQLDAADRVRQTSTSYHLHHYFQLVTGLQIELYRGDAEAALALLSAQWRALDASMLLRVQSIRIEANFARARVLLTAARARPGDAPRLVRAAASAAAAMRKSGAAWGEALAELIDAGVVARGDEPELAAARFGRAAELAAAADMAHIAAAARARRGELVGGTEGSALVAEARQQLAADGVRDPDRVLALLAPGA